MPSLCRSGEEDKLRLLSIERFLFGAEAVDAAVIPAVVGLFAAVAAKLRQA
jgi:hypothetical protein